MGIEIAKPHLQLVSHEISEYYPIPSIHFISDLRETISQVVKDVCKKGGPLCIELQSFQDQVESIIYEIADCMSDAQDDGLDYQHWAIIKSIQDLETNPNSSIWIDNLHHQTVLLLNKYRQEFLGNKPTPIRSSWGKYVIEQTGT